MGWEVAPQNQIAGLKINVCVYLQCNFQALLFKKKKKKELGHLIPLKGISDIYTYIQTNYYVHVCIPLTVHGQLVFVL